MDIIFIGSYIAYVQLCEFDWTYDVLTDTFDL